MVDIANTAAKSSNSAYGQQIAAWLSPLASRKASIINPTADAIIFYASPLWAVMLLLGLSQTDLWYAIDYFDYEHGVLSFMIGVLTTSHLLAVVYRSHLNPTVFKRWPIRFTLVPLLLFAMLNASMWVMVAATVLAVFWDVYHSGMQNFGLARIYDMKAGNDAKTGRFLDSMISQVLYAGPIAAGATLAFHMESFDSFADVGAAALTTVPGVVDGHAQLIRWIVIPASLVAWAVYIVGYWRLSRRGYKVAPQKVILMATTALASIIAWGFNPFATAFAIMNLFHAVQYYGILYAREGDNLTKTCRADRAPKSAKPWIIAAILLLPTVAYGVWEMLASPGWDVFYAAILTVALMHFWYDGFIWSVRKKEV